MFTDNQFSKIWQLSNIQQCRQSTSLPPARAQCLRDLKLTCYSAKTKKILKENDDVLINKTRTLKHDQAVTFKLVSLHEILSDRDEKGINSEPRGCAT